MTQRNMEWTVSPGQTGYLDAVAAMEARVAAIRAGLAPEWVWLLEHPPLYTAGTSAKPADLLDPDRFPVFQAGRGGQYTYHGPGQRVAYVMLDLKARGGDIRAYVNDLEEWIIRSLDHFAIRAERRAGRVGIWVETGQGREAKIAALGVRVRQGVTYHGVAINLDPDLSHFAGIVPCGLQDSGVTSIWALGHTPSIEDLDLALKSEWGGVFG
ncbi:MAG: lipoyl(octanoyl) transferase LipB [Alphaproteobacteria bacterium]|nr:lipoyl(octanoyl) transferase LipB [Alphaproteobacteria bacterium]